MTIEQSRKTEYLTRLICNYPGCDNVSVKFRANAHQIRKELKKVGWTRKGQEDYCYKHYVELTKSEAS